jgi:hypothetical protein
MAYQLRDDERLLDISASELAPGDVVIEDGVPLVVEEEPLTMHRGLGMFDEFELLIGVRVRALAAPARAFLTRRPEERVRVSRSSAQR